MVAEIPNRELADSAQLYDRPHTEPLRRAPMQAPTFASRNLNDDLAKILAAPDVCSKLWIWRQYDYMVRTNTLAGPGGDAAIVRVKETGSSIAISLDGNGRYCYLSPREGVMLNVAECCRTIDEVRVYSTPLSQADIQTDMNVPVGGSVQDTQSPSSPANAAAIACPCLPEEWFER